MIALTLEKGEPRVLLRERPKLVGTFTYEFRQPYHTAEKMPLDKAADFIERCEFEAKDLASVAVERAQTEVRQRGFRVTSCGLLLASGKPLPSLEKILASHALIHSADGELFREAIVQASHRCKLRLSTIKERELLANGGQLLKARKETLLRRLTALGKGMGPPWSQDEKYAALAAWMSLVVHKAVSFKS